MITADSFPLLKQCLREAIKDLRELSLHAKTDCFMRVITNMEEPELPNPTSVIRKYPVPGFPYYIECWSKYLAPDSEEDDSVYSGEILVYCAKLLLEVI